MADCGGMSVAAAAAPRTRGLGLRKRQACRPGIRPPSGADLITGSSLHNLKELRPGSAGRTEIRILFIFDPQRQAVLLVAGDKAGSWTRWYRDAIKLAEDLYARFLATSPKEIQ